MIKRTSTLFLFAFSTLFGEPVQKVETEGKQELELLFQQDFLESAEKGLLDAAAGLALAFNDAGITLDKLKEEFHLLLATPEIQERFLSIYASIFSAQELPEVLALVQDSRYQAYKRKLACANMGCFAETKKILEEALSNLTAPLPEPAEEPTPDPMPVPEPEVVKIEKIILPIVHIHRNNLDHVLASHRYVVVDSYTDWCGPCKNLAKVMNELQQEYGDEYQFAKLDAEKERGIAKAWKIASYPTVLFFKNGKEVGRHRGFMNKDAFLSELDRYFSSDQPRMISQGGSRSNR
jgi:thioredoxin 1